MLQTVRASVSYTSSLLPISYPRELKMADIDVEDVLSKLDLEEKVSLLAGRLPMQPTQD